jgi:hypothetical protein
MLTKCLIVWKNIKLFLKEADKLMEVTLKEMTEILMQNSMIDSFHQQMKV